jgi:hypothetical protein
MEEHYVCTELFVRRDTTCSVLSSDAVSTRFSDVLIMERGERDEKEGL